MICNKFNFRKNLLKIIYKSCNIITGKNIFELAMIRMENLYYLNDSIV